MSHSWWWHVFHDPMNENPWSLVAGIVMIGGSLSAMFAIETWRSRRRHKRVGR